MAQKLQDIEWPLLGLVTMVACIGFCMLYSAAHESMQPWALGQMARFIMGLGLFFLVAVVDIRFWLKWAYVFYIVTLVLLIAVDIRGAIGMGAQRWIDFGIIRLQPSEIMKISLILALAKYFHGLAAEDVRKNVSLLFPLFLVFTPVVLVLIQPDLGTAMLLLMGAGAIFFVSGVQMWKFATVFFAGVGSIPILWTLLHDYQKNRILTFLDPQRDPLGAGYHILQSIIAIGSGGALGKGYLQGTQSHLDFLPEQQTDFIFTMYSEEFGLLGAFVLIALYSCILAYGYVIALRSKSHFGHLLGFGLTTNFFLYLAINMSMVMGIVPVVGVPLPLMSYGGSAMLAVMAGFGFIMNVHIHRDIRIARVDGLV